MMTALPATSHSAKTASVSNPTQAASAVIGSGMRSERVAGLADPKQGRSSPLGPADFSGMSLELLELLAQALVESPG